MNKLLRTATLFGMAALLLSCATAAQRQLQGMVAGNRAAMLGFQSCAAAIYNEPELEPLRADLPLDLRNPSLAQLANSNFVSEPEIRLILVNHPKLQACRNQLIGQLSDTMPTVVPLFVQMTTNEDNDLLELLRRKIAWGEFLQRVRETINHGDAAITAEGQRVLAGLQQAHEAELARRQAAAQAIGNALAEYGRTQQMISRMNQPINCTTMDIRPGFSTTNCN